MKKRILCFLLSLMVAAVALLAAPTNAVADQNSYLKALMDAKAYLLENIDDEFERFVISQKLYVDEVGANNGNGGIDFEKVILINYIDGYDLEKYSKNLKILLAGFVEVLCEKEEGVYEGYIGDEISDSDRFDCNFN